jgi:hypothetical protein
MPSLKLRQAGRLREWEDEGLGVRGRNVAIVARVSCEWQV